MGFIRASKEACHEDDSLITPMNLMDLMVVVLVNKKEPFLFFGYTSNIQQSTYDCASV